MKNLFEFINLFGIHVDESTPYIVVFAAYYLILSLGVLLTVLNISMYLLSIYIVSNERLLSKIPSNYVIIQKLIVFYKKTRIGFLIFEVIFLFLLLLLMIGISYGLVSFYLENK